MSRRAGRTGRVSRAGRSSRAARSRGATLAVVLALAAPVLGACSSDPFESYCAEVDEQRPTLSDAASLGATTGLLTALPAFEALAEAAPDDISDDWSIVVSRIGALAEALDEADVDPSTYDAEAPPQGLAEEDRLRIEGAAAQLLNPALSTALGEVEQHARDVCGVSLSQ